MIYCIKYLDHARVCSCPFRLIDDDDDDIHNIMVWSPLADRCLSPAVVDTDSESKEIVRDCKMDQFSGPRLQFCLTHHNNIIIMVVKS
jgi:hypothetical protein